MPAVEPDQEVPVQALLVIQPADLFCMCSLFLLDTYLSALSKPCARKASYSPHRCACKSDQCSFHDCFLAENSLGEQRRIKVGRLARPADGPAMPVHRFFPTAAHADLTGKILWRRREGTGGRGSRIGPSTVAR